MVLHKLVSATVWEVNKLKTKTIAKRVTIASFALIFLLTFVSITPALAIKPLYGEMNLEFNLDWFSLGYQTEVPDWVGSIIIGETTYGMLFFAFETGKPFADPQGNSNRLFFGEIWAIYEMDGDEFPEIPEADPDAWAVWLPKNNPKCVMWGYDAGLTNFANSKYRMNGVVTYATGEFAEWEGRKVHMSGFIVWYPDGGPPHYAPGTFRIN